MHFDEYVCVEHRPPSIISGGRWQDGVKQLNCLHPYVAGNCSCVEAMPARAYVPFLTQTNPGGHKSQDQPPAGGCCSGTVHTSYYLPPWWGASCHFLSSKGKGS